jgi:hypothetical protein
LNECINVLPDKPMHTCHRTRDFEKDGRRHVP